MKKERKFNTRKYLVIEPHIDDFEIGMSVWLKKQANFPSEVTIITLCNGRENSDAVSRTKKREENIETFKNLYPNIEIIWKSIGYSDLVLESFTTNKLIMSVDEALKTSGFLDGIVGLNIFKEIYIPQADNHPDHSKCNLLGKIITRSYNGKVFEFIIQNSQYMETGNWNTVIKAEYKFADKKDNKKYIDCCIYPLEKTSFQYTLYAQKSYDGKFISDRFNLIKDVFITSEDR